MAWLVSAVLFAVPLMAQDVSALRKERDKLSQRGLWRDALKFYQEKLLPVSDKDSGKDLERAFEALEGVNAITEFDSLVESAVATHPENSGLLVMAAFAYSTAPHSGRPEIQGPARPAGIHRHRPGAEIYFCRPSRRHGGLPPGRARSDPG